MKNTPQVAWIEEQIELIPGDYTAAMRMVSVRAVLAHAYFRIERNRQWAGPEYSARFGRFGWLY